MKGIILAGGSGTRLYPVTQVDPSSCFPVYDKPMIYYPLSTLMLAGIKKSRDLDPRRNTPALRATARDGKSWGMEFSYAVQPN